MVVDEKLETRIHEWVSEHLPTSDPQEQVLISSDFVEFIKNIPSREDKVKEFHQTFNQVINDKPIKINVATVQLRMNLLLEELDELGEALGFKRENYFIENPMNKYYSDLADGNAQNLLKAFDALLDLQYVLSGTIVSLGMADIFEEGFDEVHRSNMSKCCDTYEDAHAEASTVPHHITIQESPNGKFILQRTSDNKTIKPSTYSPANLQPILDKAK